MPNNNSNITFGCPLCGGRLDEYGICEKCGTKFSVELEPVNQKPQTYKKKEYVKFADLSAIMKIFVVLGIMQTVEIGLVLILFILGLFIRSSSHAPIDKPVIYLYGYENEEVNVQIDFKDNAGFTCTYPEYKEDGWTVSVRPDGHLVDKDGRVYRYLYWEGEGFDDPDFSKGFCVRGEFTSSFLEVKLKEMGLNDDEINEFIIYWLPKMEDNEYNIISFQTDAYTDLAELNVDPLPDSMLRVYMAWYPSDHPVDIEPQTFTKAERTGRYVVEWGGSEFTPEE